MPAFLPIISGINVAGLVAVILLASRVMAIIRFARWGSRRVGAFFDSRGR